MHVLVIDDDPTILEMITVLLTFEQFETTAAPNLKEAYRVLDSLSPDVICCDMMMPDGGGLRLLEEQRNRTGDNNVIPVIVITGSDSDQRLSRAEALGSAAIVPKPFSTEDLVKAIHTAVHTFPPQNTMKQLRRQARPAQAAA